MSKFLTELKYPLIHLQLSQQTEANIFGKAEFMNPGGSVKDRVTLIKDAIKNKSKPGGTIIGYSW